jgi:hypothetical protein
VSKDNSKNRLNKVVFKIKTPKGTLRLKDITDNMDKIIEIECLDMRSGSRIGTFKLEEFKLKFL